MKPINLLLLCFAFVAVCGIVCHLYVNYSEGLNENEEALAANPKDCNLDCINFICKPGMPGPICVCGLDYGK